MKLAQKVTSLNGADTQLFVSGDALGSESTVRDQLEQAIGTGQLIGIIYHGGSQPGAYREIAPIQISVRWRRTGVLARFMNRIKACRHDNASRYRT